MREALCMDTQPRLRAVLPNHLEEYGVHSMLSCRICSINEHSATVIGEKGRKNHRLRHHPSYRLRTQNMPCRQSGKQKYLFYNIGYGNNGVRICDPVWIEKKQFVCKPFIHMFSAYSAFLTKFNVCEDNIILSTFYIVKTIVD